MRALPNVSYVQPSHKELRAHRQNHLSVEHPTPDPFEMEKEIKIKRTGENTPGKLNPYKGEKAPIHNTGVAPPNHPKRGNTSGEHTPNKGQTPSRGDHTPSMVIANHQTRDRAPNHTTVTGKRTTRRVNNGNNLPQLHHSRTGSLRTTHPYLLWRTCNKITISKCKAYSSIITNSSRSTKMPCCS